jgi:two-component system response regulator MprA
MSCTALLVEDDKDIRDSLLDELTELGCEVVPVPNGLAALHELKGGLRPDFILLDLLMPEMSGPELLRALKSDLVLATIPVVLMSASRIAAVVSDANGSEKVLHKPLRRWQLEQIVSWFAGTAGVASKRSEPA